MWSVDSPIITRNLLESDPNNSRFLLCALGVYASFAAAAERRQASEEMDCGGHGRRVPVSRETLPDNNPPQNGCSKKGPEESSAKSPRKPLKGI